MLTFYFSGADGRMIEPEILTTGMVGKQVKIEFSEDWDSLIKTAVFSDGTVVRDVVLTGDTAVIPADVLVSPMRPFLLGIYGVTEDGTEVIPTIRAVGPQILPGADPSGDPGTDPDLPVWAQLQTMMGEAVRTVNGIGPDDSGNIRLPENCVQFVGQTLTENQQAIARENIGAASAADVETALSTANTAKTNAANASSRANLAYSSAAKANTAANDAQDTADSAIEWARALSTGKLDAAGISTRTITAVTADGNTVTLNVLIRT